MKTMRIFLMVALIGAMSMCGFAASSHRETIVGTVIAYNQVLGLVRLTSTPSGAAFLVRTQPTRHQPSQLIEVHYSYWYSDKSNGRGFPDELVASARMWRFKLTRDTACGPLQDAVPFTDVNTGKEIGERLPIWKLLSSAEHETLPFGKTLPCYLLEAHDYKPVAP